MEEHNEIVLYVNILYPVFLISVFWEKNVMMRSMRIYIFLIDDQVMQSYLLRLVRTQHETMGETS